MALKSTNRIGGLAILLALRQRGMGVSAVAKATGHARWWLSRRISGRIVPTVSELDQLAAIIGVRPSYLRYHFARPTKPVTRAVS